MAEPYRPSNGTEGESFMGQWCSRCRKDSEEKPCPIIGWTMAVDVDDPNYPKEWVQDAKGPRCTAFSSDAQPLTEADIKYLAWKAAKEKPHADR
jgi:hypothetical protein